MTPHANMPSPVKEAVHDKFERMFYAGMKLVKQNRVEEITGLMWAAMLIHGYQRYDLCDWDKLTPGLWCWILRIRPSLVEYCGWDKLNKEQWTWVADQQPYFKDHPMYKLKML